MGSQLYNLLKKYPLSRYADPLIIRRGRTYYDEGRVWNVEMVGNNKAFCNVEGESGDYTVEIGVNTRANDLYFECDCPYAEKNFCKHMVAAVLELREFLDDGSDEEGEEEEDFTIHKPSPPKSDWQNKLDTVVLQYSRPEPAGPNKLYHYAAVFLMARDDYTYHSYYSFRPYVIKARSWKTLLDMDPNDRQAVNDLLERNYDWYIYGEDLYSQTNPAACLNLSAEAVRFLQFMQQYPRYIGGVSATVNYFSMLAQLQIPVFQVSKKKNAIQSRITVLPNPVDIEIHMDRGKDGIVMSAGLKDASFSPGSHKMEIITYNPPWLLADDKLFSLNNSGDISILSALPITVPDRDANIFREKYLRKVAETLPIHGDLVHWREVHADLTPRLYLHEDRDKKLRADLRFAYGEHEMAASKSGDAYSIETLPNSWDLLKVYRDPERERQLFQQLSDSLYRLKRASSVHPYGTFELRARAHPFDFLMYSIPLLAQAGFEIYGEDKLKTARINRSTPVLRVQITSGIDWFDLKAVVEFGDQSISLQDVRRAIKHGERYIKLADGSVGQVPSDWLEKYKHLWNLGKETNDGYRVSDFHLPLIDSLLEGDVKVQVPPDLQQRRERFRSFKQIDAQPTPDNFQGELRLYQKHGFDWLHFLREYKFGGILADDMGLGKTIQVLAYLQSLREKDVPGRTALLVVPKSLIANWEREAERFTPSLRFLEYMGNTRIKDTSTFKDYDVVLTTYGTMQRDVDILRNHRFFYAILDESQAIKNPLAKSAKAARLLSADHRLVMTGTPVENNTFELWSQFAFLNPGLLGSQDYFRREFANPIESGQDEETAATLRKLIYPFILRRTKEQVAPELPPRTERVLYTDMDPAQKKLYAQTRDRYRAELMGLIESEGIQDARFKILEGLLRLRQIAIHPALVESTYRGDAPKFELLLETLETLRSEGHKALIFSQFVETLRLVRCELDAGNVKYAYLDGKTSHRQEVVDTFQNDPSISFFLISLKAGGVGLNLTAADYVIHLDPWWNPAVEMQASDRAHRIGQDKPVFIYKIITRDSVEEKILLLQEKKRALVKSLIASEASFFKSLTREDVKMLFDA